VVGVGWPPGDPVELQKIYDTPQKICAGLVTCCPGEMLRRLTGFSTIRKIFVYRIVVIALNLSIYQALSVFIPVHSSALSLIS
jgi:hypothetical protein